MYSVSLTRVAGACALALLLACMADVVAHAGDVIHVPSREAATIQEAIKLASDGDEIIVAPGTYHEAIDLLGKAVHLRSERGPEVTIIDATGLKSSVVMIASGEGPDTIIEGFTITGGTGIESVNGGVGGGLYVYLSTPVIRKCVIAHNTAWLGGGMYIAVSAWNGGEVSVEDTHFIGNMTDGIWNSGGAVAMVGNASFVNCTFDSNASTSGGGIYFSQNSSGVSGDVHVESCNFTSNVGAAIQSSGQLSVANSSFTGNEGGGIRSIGPHPFSVVLSVTNSHFEDNVFSPYPIPSNSGGGAINIHRGTATISESTFINNTAPEYFGGAINVGGTHVMQVSISHCTFIGNSAQEGGAAYLGSGADQTLFAHNTLESNSAHFGGGLRVIPKSAKIEHCTIRKNTAVWGGGMRGTGIVSNSTIEENTAMVFGGGVYAAGATIEDSTIAGNTALRGGGIYGTFRLANSSVRDNVATDFAGGIRAFDSSVIANSVIANNTAMTEGGGVLTGMGFHQCFMNTLLCENDPDHILGDWHDLGGNALLDVCPDDWPPLDDADSVNVNFIPCPPPVFGDLNGDLVVDGADLAILLSNWGPCGAGICPADLNGDGTVNGFDLVILLGNWGSG